MSTLTNRDFRQEKQKDRSWFSNPVMSKFSKIDEYSDDHVTYRGIARKCGFFVIAILVGIALAIASRFASFGLFDVQDLPVSDVTLIGFCVFLLCMLVSPIIAVLAKKTTPVTGSLFCVSVGFIYTVSALVIEDYTKPILLALIITLALFAALTGLFYAGVIKVDAKFRSISMILAATLIISSVLLLVGYFVPATHGIVTFVFTNPLICIGFSVVSVIIVSMFLLNDIARIKEAVDRKLPVKYEWSAAFGLVFSLIWLFIEVLELITNVTRFSK